MTTAIPIHKEPIRLSQFLKLADIVQDGLEAKIRIIEGEIMVNGEVEIRRGRKLYTGDRVSVEGQLFEVVTKE